MSAPPLLAHPPAPLATHRPAPVPAASPPATTVDAERLADRDVLAAELTERVLAAIPTAVDTALAPLQAVLPDLARALLLDGTWTPARLADRLFAAPPAETAARAVRTMIETSLPALCGHGMRVPRVALPLPLPPCTLARPVMEAVAEGRRTVLAGAVVQKQADKSWCRAVGTFLPPRWSKPALALFKPELKRLTWTNLILVPAGLDARTEWERVVALVTKQLSGLLAAWALRIREALETGAVAAIYALVDRTTGHG